MSSGDPIPRVDDIEASADPLFEAARQYLFDERKAAQNGWQALVI